MKGKLYRNKEGHMASSLLGPIILNVSKETEQDKRNYKEALRWGNAFIKNMPKPYYLNADGWYIYDITVNTLSYSVLAMNTGTYSSSLLKKNGYQHLRVYRDSRSWLFPYVPLFERDIYNVVLRLARIPDDQHPSADRFLCCHLFLADEDAVNFCVLNLFDNEDLLNRLQNIDDETSAITFWSDEAMAKLEQNPPDDNEVIGAGEIQLTLAGKSIRHNTQDESLRDIDIHHNPGILYTAQDDMPMVVAIKLAIPPDTTLGDLKKRFIGKTFSVISETYDSISVEDVCTLYIDKSEGE